MDDDDRLKYAKERFPIGSLWRSNETILVVIGYNLHGRGPIDIEVSEHMMHHDDSGNVRTAADREKFEAMLNQPFGLNSAFANNLIRIDRAKKR